MKAIPVPWRYKDLYDDDICYTYRISGDFFYAIAYHTCYFLYFLSCYNKYYTNTSLCILQSLQQSLSENQTIAKVTVNVTEIPPPAIDCIECLWIR